jgi:hypothetical protein
VSTTTSGSTTFVASSRPAEPDLDHGDLDAGVGEREEGDGGRRLEERRLFPLDAATAAPPQPAARLVDGSAVDADALAERAEVG